MSWSMPSKNMLSQSYACILLAAYGATEVFYPGGDIRPLRIVAMAVHLDVLPQYVMVFGYFDIGRPSICRSHDDDPHMETPHGRVAAIRPTRRGQISLLSSIGSFREQSVLPG